jgi:hypothetical protein
MKKLCTILFALSLLTSVGLVAQDTASQDSMKQGSASADAAVKATTIAGTISEDGKTFVSDKDNKTWTITNPDAVKGHEGHHVALKAHVDASKSEVDVVALKMLQSK